MARDMADACGVQEISLHPKDQWARTVRHAVSGFVAPGRRREIGGQATRATTFVSQALSFPSTGERDAPLLPSSCALLSWSIAPFLH